MSSTFKLPFQADHGGNIQADEDGIADLEISVTKGWALFGEQNVLDKTLVIYENENDDKRIGKSNF